MDYPALIARLRVCHKAMQYSIYEEAADALEHWEEVNRQWEMLSLVETTKRHEELIDLCATLGEQRDSLASELAAERAAHLKTAQVAAEEAEGYDQIMAELCALKAKT